MKLEQYKITVEFDLVVREGWDQADKIALDLNGLFNNVVKTWARDKQAMASSTKTTVESGVDA